MEFIRNFWPQLMSFLILITIFTRMRVDIDVLKEKVKTLFELFNKKDQIIHLKFGVPISHETLLNSNKNHEAERIQTLTSSL